MKKALLKCGFAMAAAFVLSSCATIFGGSRYTFVVNSSPEAAQLVVTNKKGREVFNGNTPATLRLKSGAGYFSPAMYNLKFNKPGYAEQTVPVRFNLNGWYFGNILLGGAIGMLVVDPLTGGMWKVNNAEKNIYRKLKPQRIAVNNEAALNIIDINTLDEEMKQQLVKIN